MAFPGDIWEEQFARQLQVFVSSEPSPSYEDKRNDRSGKMTWQTKTRIAKLVLSHFAIQMKD